jgi:hypothetical protein
MQLKSWTYKKVARELQEKLERTNHYYQGQIISYEKKKLILIGWWTRLLKNKYFKKANASNRQKLIKMELEFELVEKYPYTFVILNAAYDKEHFPEGKGFAWFGSIGCALFPVNPRSQCIRRGSLPLPPPGNTSGTSPDYSPSRDSLIHTSSISNKQCLFTEGFP